MGGKQVRAIRQWAVLWAGTLGAGAAQAAYTVTGEGRIFLSESSGPDAAALESVLFTAARNFYSFKAIVTDPVDKAGFPDAAIYQLSSWAVKVNGTLLAAGKNDHWQQSSISVENNSPFHGGGDALGFSFQGRKDYAPALAGTERFLFAIYRPMPSETFADTSLPNDFSGLLTSQDRYIEFSLGTGTGFGPSDSSVRAFVLPTSFTVTNVPEPSSWALMIIGFAAAGARVRRSRLAIA